MGRLLVRIDKGANNFAILVDGLHEALMSYMDYPSDERFARHVFGIKRSQLSAHYFCTHHGSFFNGRLERPQAERIF
jgi:hypothetical protein